MDATGFYYSTVLKSRRTLALSLSIVYCDVTFCVTLAQSINVQTNQLRCSAL